MNVALDVHTQAQIADEIAGMLELFDDWWDKYELLSDLGKELPSMDPADKTKENRVSGCENDVWVVAHARRTDRGPVIDFSADSDAAITKGLVSILWRLNTGQNPENILTFDIESFIERLGLNANLTAKRQNGLSGMVKRVKARNIGVCRRLNRTVL